MTRGTWGLLLAAGAWSLGVSSFAYCRVEPFAWDSSVPRWLPGVAWAVAFGITFFVLGVGVWRLVRRQSTAEAECAAWLASGVLGVVGAGAVEVAILHQLHGMTLASGLAKLGLALHGRVEVLVHLCARAAASSGLLAASAAVLVGSVRVDPSPRAWRWLLWGSASLWVIGVLCFVWPALDYLGLVESASRPAVDLVDPWDRLARARLRLLVGAGVAGLAWVVAAALIVIAYRERIGRLPRSNVVALELGFLGLACAMFYQARPLARENAEPLPGDGAFANLTLGFPPPLGISGTGPDPLRDMYLVRVRHGEPYDRSTTLGRGSGFVPSLAERRRASRELGLELPESISVSVQKDVPVSVLREWLTRVRQEGYQQIDLQMTVLLKRSTPRFGELTGVRHTAVATHLATTETDCPDGSRPVLMHPPAEGLSEDWVRGLAVRRERGEKLCLVVGQGVCRTEKRSQWDCLQRLGVPARVIRRATPGPGLVAMTVEVGGREFDALSTSKPSDIGIAPVVSGGVTVRERARELEAEGRRVHLVMNAGMYHPGYRPVGLLIAGGDLEQPLEEGLGQGNFFLLPNGVFGVAQDRQVVTVQSTSRIATEFAQLSHQELQPEAVYTEATQSGPLLLQRGQLHPSIDPKSSNRVVRNAVGTSGETTAVFVISREPVTFFELATALGLLGCADGLYLDGVVSSAHLPALGRTRDSRRLGPLVSVSRGRDD